MGAWGYGIYDNDGALDAVIDIEDNLKECNNDYTKALTKYREDYFANGVVTGSDNYAVLLAADMEIKNTNNLKIFKDLVLQCLEKELSKETLSSWNEPEKRQKKLLDFKKTVDKYL